MKYCNRAFSRVSVCLLFYGLFEDWESSTLPAVQRRQLSKHSSLTGAACPVHRITRPVLANVCVDINCGCYLCRTHLSVPTTAGGVGNQLPYHEVVIALPDFHCLRQAGGEEGSLHLCASCTSLEISEK